MEKYLGVKLVEAEPQLKGYSLGMTKPNQAISEHDFNIPGYKVVYEDGYTSWSPKEVFEKSYKTFKFYLDVFPHVTHHYDDFKDWQKRVCGEAQELEEKIYALEDYMMRCDTNFNVLPKEKQTQLNNQLLAMQYYLTILVERINNF